MVKCERFIKDNFKIVIFVKNKVYDKKNTISNCFAFRYCFNCFFSIDWKIGLGLFAGFILLYTLIKKIF